MPLPTLIVLGITLALALPAGLVILVKGLRGKPVDDHPICARCGFDLHGVLSREDVGTGKACTDCGTPIKYPENLRIGNRRRRPGLIRLGGAVLGITLACMVPTAGLLFAGGAVARHMPTAVLLLWVRYSDAAAAGDPMGVLIERADRAVLSEDELRTLALLALDVQRNPGRAWSKEWEQVLARQDTQGVLTREEVASAFFYALDLSISVRPTCRHGGPLPISVDAKVNDRFLLVGQRSIQLGEMSARIKGQPPDAVRVPNTHAVLPTAMKATYGQPTKVAVNVAPGEYEIEFELPFWSVATGTLAYTPPPGSPSGRLHVTRRFRVLEPGTPAVELVSDPATVAAIKSAVELSIYPSPSSVAKRWVSVGVAVIGGNPARPLPSEQFQRGDVRGYFRVQAQPLDDNDAQAGSPIDLGNVGLWMSQESSWGVLMGGGYSAEDFGGRRFRMCLVPDPDGAEKTIEYTRILGDTIVLDKVEIVPAR